MNQGRRDWLLAALLFAFGAGRLAAQPGPPPSFIVIMTEDHRADALGIEGHPIAATPNLDRLAREGTRFTQAYTACPSPAAGRQAILTGRSPHALGVTLSYTPLRDGSVTLAHVFGLHDYETGFYGEPHFFSDRRHGFRRLATPRRLAEDAAERGLAGLPPKIDAAQPIQPAWRPFADPAEIWLNAANLPVGAFARSIGDRRLAEEAARFAEVNRGRSFALVIALRGPQAPFAYPADFEGPRFNPADMTPPEVSAQDAARQPLAFAGLSREARQGIMAAYFTSLAFADSLVGYVLEELDRLAMARNTVVVYLSDGGQPLGERGFFDNRCMIESAIRSPLIVRWPGRVPAGARVEAPVELMDLLPTLLDLAGIPPPPKLEGRSFRAALEGKPFAGRERVLCEYPENREAALREGPWKLIYASGTAPRADGLRAAQEIEGRRIELYNLQADPGETRDLAREPGEQPRVRRMLAAMAERLREGRPGGFSLPAGVSAEDELDLQLIPSELWPSTALLMHAQKEFEETEARRRRPREGGGN